MTIELQATEFARQWVAAWNSHDLDAIMSHYDVDVVLTSPVAAKILDDPSGTVEGNAALRNYFKRGLEVYPNLHFELLDVMHGLCSSCFATRIRKAQKRPSSWSSARTEKSCEWSQTTAANRQALNLHRRRRVQRLEAPAFVRAKDEAGNPTFTGPND